MPLRRTLTALTAGACLAAVGLQAEAETLADAIALAYQTNPQIQAQRAELRALNESYVQARSQFGPRLSAEADLNYQEIRSGARHFEGRSSSETLALSQPIFTGGRVGSTVQASEADIRAGRERLRQAEADLLVRVINAYVAVRRDQQILAVAQATVSVLEQQLVETQAKTDVRENTRTDLAQAQARLAAAQSQLASAEAALASSRALYLNQVGQNPGDLAPEPDLGLVPAAIEEAFERAEGRNPTLLAAKFAEQASRARVTAARSQNMPSVGLRVQAGRAPTDLKGPDYLNSVTAQAVISQPLFTAGQNSSQIRRALELNNADRLVIDATRRNIVQSVSQQWSQLSAARRSLVADQTNVSASEMAFYGMRQEERQGLRSTIELLNAQQELTSAQIGLLRDRYTEYVARAGLLNVMGVLTVDVLAPGVAAYDAEADFDRVKNKGALPTELVPRALDAVVVPGLGPPMAARETTVPNGQLALPPTPPPAVTQAPITPATTLMDETRADPSAR
jgi:TolC family type I secretion outer membrane protein